MAGDGTASVVVSLAQALPRFDVTCYAGRPFSVSISTVQGDGSPLPAAAVASARAHIRPQIDSDQVLHSFDTADDPVDAVVTDGFLTFTATSEVTTGWGELFPGRAPASVCWWDIEITDADGEPWQMSEAGTFTVVHQVTR